MSVAAAQKQFRQEMIAEFEATQSLVRDSVTTEAVIKGNEAEFLVAGSGGASAVTRGVNGRIPARSDSNTQTTVTLVEWHDKVEKTRFNIFASQGDQRALMQRTTMGVINRKIDDDIITELNTGTVNTGTASTASHDLCLKAKTILQNSDVPWDNSITALITPAFEAYLEKIEAYANADYVDLKPMENPNAWSDKVKARRWMGVNWINHPNLPGAGTSAEKCFMYHKSALGHAVNTDGMDTAIGYNDEDDYSFARCTIFMGTQILQNSGVVVINHDGSAWAAS
ncbi:MAG: phage capsid protein [Ruegeria sp.]|nr:phage capsid protein [Ruegeria sp.]